MISRKGSQISEGTPRRRRDRKDSLIHDQDATHTCEDIHCLLEQVVFDSINAIKIFDNMLIGGGEKMVCFSARSRPKAPTGAGGDFPELSHPTSPPYITTCLADNEVSLASLHRQQCSMHHLASADGLPPAVSPLRCLSTLCLYGPIQTGTIRAVKH